MKTWTLFVFILLNLQVTKAPNPNCRCGNSKFMSVWGQWTGSSQCIGICDVSVRTRTRNCMSTINGHILPVISCEIIESCVNEHSCQGTWTRWGNFGSCNSTCGPGHRIQTRNCYLFGNIRNDYCLGGKGRPEENRTVTCTNRPCSTPSTLTGPTVTATTTTKPTSPQTSSNSPTTVDGRVDTPNTRVSPESSTSMRPTSTLDPAPPPTPAPQVDTVTLGAVLGSVALICVTILAVAVTCILYKKRKKSNFGHSQEYSAATNVTMLSQIPGNGNYESVGPPLPNRPVEPNGSNPAQIVTNALYEPMIEGKDDSTLPAQVTTETPYLEPLPPPSPIIPEAIYFSIEDTRRL